MGVTAGAVVRGLGGGRGRKIGVVDGYRWAWNLRLQCSLNPQTWFFLILILWSLQFIQWSPCCCCSLFEMSLLCRLGWPWMCTWLSYCGFLSTGIMGMCHNTGLEEIVKYYFLMCMCFYCVSPCVCVYLGECKHSLACNQGWPWTS